MMRKNSVVLIGLILLIAFGCQNDDTDIGSPVLMAEEGEEFSGGDYTIQDSSSDAFGLAGSVLTIPERNSFAVGRSLFRQAWVTAPSSTTARDGLGPIFNARRCLTCHKNDGRGRPPQFEGEIGSGLLLRLSIGNNELTGKIPHPIYGGQLQDQAILGQLVEGNIHIEYTSTIGSYADGTTYELLKPNYSVANQGYGDVDNVLISPRVAPPMIGLGLIDAISEDDILANQDINDSDGNGISGKANYVWNVLENQNTIGRYGWKASQPTIDQQAAGAANGDMGLTTPIFPEENCPFGVDCSEIPNGGSPEIEQNNFNQLAFYSATLGVPIRRNWENQNVLRGKQLFSDLQCASCHIPKFITSPSEFTPSLAGQTIYPYTDLLLHDMGEELSDNAPEFLALGREWRTPPLWGIGLTEIVSGHTRFLHDGRARNIEEAILWHGGEAENSKEEFKNLLAEERKDLLDFLNSL